MPVLKSEIRRFVSFDGQVSAEAEHYRPERYSELEGDLGTRPRIPRGGGYSYAAASFGKGVAVQDMGRFCRLLRFDHHSGALEAEAGLTIGELLAFSIPRGYWLPVAPGHPGITLGGCLGSNVHGKNPYKHGVFSQYVTEFVLFHPAHGKVHVSRDSNPCLFDLTCGGFGLTGIIESMTLKLVPFPGTSFHVSRTPVLSHHEALEALNDYSLNSEYAYSFHNPTATCGFGKGYVLTGKLTKTEHSTASEPSRHPTQLASITARRLNPVPVWGSWRSTLIHSIFWHFISSRPIAQEVPWPRAEFPLAFSPHYFTLYGRRGFCEYQMIIPSSGAIDFFADFEALVRRHRPDGVMCSLKLFKATERYLNFAKDGVCFTMDFAANPSTKNFLKHLDEMCVSYKGIPNLIKDSRLKRQTVAATYAEYGSFRSALATYDPKRYFQSELSQRLDI